MRKRSGQGSKLRELRQKNKTPPGGWRYTDPDTGFYFDERYSSLLELVGRVKQYRLFNELAPIPNLSLVIEDWLCCQDRDRMDIHCREVKIVSRTLRQYLKGAQASAKMIAAGEKAYVSQQVADARAEMCVGCRSNKKNNKHSRLERYTDKYVESMVGNRKTSFDDKLFSCEVCSCPLRAKVHVSHKITQEALTRKERKVLSIPLLDFDGVKFRCWQMKQIIMRAK